MRVLIDTHLVGVFVYKHADKKIASFHSVWQVWLVTVRAARALCRTYCCVDYSRSCHAVKILSRPYFFKAVFGQGNGRWRRNPTGF
jgi:hypothetical protein